MVEETGCNINLDRILICKQLAGIDTHFQELDGYIMSVKCNFKLGGVGVFIKSRKRRE